MSQNSPPSQSSNNELERELRQGRPFSLAAAIAQEAGGFLKGDSPVPALTQAKATVCNFIRDHLGDTSGTLQLILCRWMEDDLAQLSHHLHQPVFALQALLQAITTNPEQLYELARQVNIAWGEANNERPHFQRPHQVPHPDAEYTHASVQAQLLALAAVVEAATASVEADG